LLFFVGFINESLFLKFMNVQESNAVIIQLGKNGVSAQLIDNTKKNLANNKLVKIKFLKNALEGKSRKELALLITEELRVPVEQKLVGNVLFLKRIKK